MPTFDELVEHGIEEEVYLLFLIRKSKRLLRAGIRRLERKIINVMKQLDTDKGGALLGLKANLKRAQKVHKKVMVLWEQEYGEAFTAVVDGFDEVAARAVKEFKVLDPKAKFTAIDRSLVTQIKTHTYSTFQDFGHLARESMAQEMYRHIIGGSDYADLLKTVRGILTGHKDIRGRSLVTLTEQYAWDAVMNFNNAVKLQKAVDAKLSHFFYAGTIMSKTRDFCLYRINRVYSKEEIESWKHSWKGKSGPALTHRGGYNCRHNWQPVNPDWIDEEDMSDEAREAQRDKLIEKQRAALARR
jgi:hypothetical protein